jgi:hypothetical protein
MLRQYLHKLPCLVTTEWRSRVADSRTVGSQMHVGHGAVPSFCPERESVHLSFYRRQARQLGGEQVEVVDSGSHGEAKQRCDVFIGDDGILYVALIKVWTSCMEALLRPRLGCTSGLDTIVYH